MFLPKVRCCVLLQNRKARRIPLRGESMKVLIIGGVAAGTKAAAKLKRMDRSLDVTIVTKGKEISYAGCGLPYYVGGVIAEKSQLIVNTPASFSALTGAKVLTEREVVCLDVNGKKAEAKNLKTGDMETYSYDACIIATGAAPIVPRLEGMSLPGVFTMRTPQDAIDIRDFLESGSPKKAVVVGGGFIGLETAENLAAQGLSVTVIDMADQIMPGFDPEMADYAKRHLIKKGIKVLTGTKMDSITGTVKAEGVMTSAGELKADLVVMSLGIRPNTAFLKDTGLEFMPNGSIPVDGKLRTNLENIYAAGDCACVTNRQTGKRAWSPMGSSANMEGRTLAKAFFGEDVSYDGVLGTAVVKLPDLNCARTGLTEAAALEEGYDVVTSLSVVDDKAHYYPGSSIFMIKVIGDKASRKLLGLQVLGSGAVDKVTDVAVTAISMGATVDQLYNLDMAYAPPFSTAIHPFVTAVYVLANKMDGVLDSMTPAEFAEGAAVDYRVVDVAQLPSIPMAPFVDLSKVDGPVEGLGKDEKLLLVCTKGRRAYMLQNRLKFYGYTNTKVLEGGLTFNVIKAGGEGKVTVSAEEITRLKGLGCLHNKGTDNFNIRVITRNGNITAEENTAIAKAAEKYGSGRIAMTTRLTMEIIGVPYDKIDALRDDLAEAGLETGGTGSKVRPVVSCKGTTCQYGLLDTYALSDKIHEMFYHGYGSVKLPHKFKIAVGGCPNNCVKPSLNDLGIIGQKVPNINETLCKGCTVCQVENVCPMKASSVVNGKLVINPDLCNNCGRCVGKCPFRVLAESTYGYRVYIGGRWGKKFAHGRALSPVFTTEEEVLSIIEKTILLFREQGQTGERLADTVERLGFENVEKQLLSNDILDRREEIIGAKLHLVGGATC